MELVPDPLQNCLLASLSPADWRRWSRLLVPVHLPVGQVLQESGRIPPAAYFPTTATVSLLYPTADGACDEIAVVGREGMIGASLYMDGQSTPGVAQVQAPGEAFMVSGQALRDEFERSSTVRRLLLRYALACDVQISQTSVCNRRHSLEQRLCRRLLQGLARQRGGELHMTQEQLAGLLGARRESVTGVAFRLQKAGVIRYARGRLAVLDPVGLGRRACECHSQIEKEYRRLLPAATAEIGFALSCGGSSLAPTRERGHRALIPQLPPVPA